MRRCSDRIVWVLSTAVTAWLALEWNPGGTVLADWTPASGDPC